MAIRMTGLASGMDTESIVNALMEAKKVKKTKIENKKTKLEWTQTIWSGMNTKLYNFYKDYAGKMRFQSNYQTKKATSSDATKVTATAKSGAAKGSYSLKVTQVAKAQYVTSAKLSQYVTKDENGNDVTKDVSSATKLSDLGFAADGSSQIQVTTGNKTVSLNVDENTTVNDFVSTLQSAGLTASFDEKQGRFFIAAKDSGEDSKFTITSNTLDGVQNNAQSVLKNAVDYTNLSSSQKTEVLNVLSDLQNSTETDKNTAAATKLKEIADSRATTVATNYYSDQKKAELTQNYLGSDGKTVTDAGKEALEKAGKYNDTMVNDDMVAELKALVSSETSAYVASEDVQNQIKDAVENGLTDASGNVLVQNKVDRDIAIQNAVDNYAGAVAGGVTEDTADNSALKKLGLGNIDGTAVAETSAGNGMVVVAAADSVIQLNGATLTSSSNTIEVNGLTLNLTGTTDEEVTITVTDDNSAVYDSIKEFINQYNTILAEMNKYYYASSARDYDVLSDDEKDAMSDDEIEKWETKIKDSLLRRDSTLGSLIDTMRMTMAGTSITASNGKTYSLANLGITTGTDYKEYGLLHIKGDEDDTEYSDSENTLEKLLNEDPDIVAEVLAGVTSKLYDSLNKKMQSTTLSSALTFYNDKEMNSQLSDYKKEISDWETKLAEIEERYYKQFTAMETAMAKLNSQQNTFANYLG